MRFAAGPALCLLLLLTIVTAKKALQLDDSTFDAAAKQDRYLFVKFYGNHCHYCVSLQPEWQRLGSMTQNQRNLVLAEVNLSDAPMLGERYQIAGVPHMMLFRGGRPVAVYQGERTAGSINAWQSQYVR